MKTNVKSATKAEEIHVISHDGFELGILTPVAARSLAASRHEVLVAINPKANPPLYQSVQYTRLAAR